MSIKTVVALAVLCLVATQTNAQDRSVTSLELAFGRAFNDRISDGTWVQIFGPTGALAQNYCTGQSYLWLWPFPNLLSDLKRSLTRGTFRCGYNADAYITTAQGGVIIDTRDPLSRPTGAVVEWFDKLAESVSAEYDTAYAIDWNVSFPTSDSVLQSVLDGEIDAACGRWVLSAGFQEENRNSAFNVQYCPTYMEIPAVWVRKNAAISTWAQLITKIETEHWQVCTPTIPLGGTETACSDLLQQYSDSQYAKCVGRFNLAFDLLLADEGCDAVFSSAPSADQARSLNQFPAPAVQSYGSLFRTADVVSLPPLPYALDVTFDE